MYSLKYHSSSSSMKIRVPLKPDRAVHTCNPTTQEAQAGRSEVPGFFGYTTS